MQFVPVVRQFKGENIYCVEMLLNVIVNILNVSE